MSIDKDIQLVEKQVVSRRNFLKNSLIASAGLAAFSPMGSALASVAKANPLENERSVSFTNLHTGEHLRTVYWEQGEYLPEALAEVNKVLRDHRSGEVYQMDYKLLDLLHNLYGEVEGKRGFEVISGYRSPATNAKLSKNSNGVAKRSLHMQGRAIDIRIPGRDLRTVQQAALSLRGGGVGYYGKSNFLHLDTGRVRRWG